MRTPYNKIYDVVCVYRGAIDLSSRSVDKEKNKRARPTAVAYILLFIIINVCVYCCYYRLYLPGIIRYTG